MIKPEPVPENLLARSLHQAFNTEEWPEWDNLDIVPESFGTPDDNFDFDHAPDDNADDSAESPNDQDLVEDAQDPADKELPDFGVNSSGDAFPTADETDLDLPGADQSDDTGSFSNDDTFDF